MEKPSAKFFLLLFILSAVIWLSSSSLMNYHAGKLLKFGTIEFKDMIDPVMERDIYRAIAEYCVLSLGSYPFVLLAGIGFLMTTYRSLKQEGWLMMSAIFIFMFIPVELYCFWLDWKLIGLNYWGEWPLEEFRKALLARISALAGLHLIAQFCYFTIPIFIIFKPLKKSGR